MKKCLLSVYLLACITQVLHGEEQPDILLSYRCKVSWADSRSVNVTARFEISNSSPNSAVFINARKDQVLTNVQIDSRTVSTGFPLTDKAVKLPLRLGSEHTHTVRFQVTSSEKEVYRVPLAVPQALPRAGGRAVSIEVDLPTGTRAFGDEFPAFVWSSGEMGKSELGSVPSLLLLRCRSGAITVGDRALAFSSVSEGLMIACLACASLFWWLRQRAAKPNSHGASDIL